MSVLDVFDLRNWFDSFSENESKILLACELFTMPDAANFPSASYFLASSLGWFSTKENSDLVLKVTDKIINLFNIDNGMLSKKDLHFFYSNVISAIYKFRDVWAGELVRELCQKSIDIAPDVVNSFNLPVEHVGFNSLIAIEKKEKNWPRVLELSRLAMSQGWAGKFQAWAAEAEGKIN